MNKPFLLKKRFITLIEMLIAMSLTVILLSAFAYFYREFDLINRSSEKLQLESFYSRYTQGRLSAVFSTAQPEYKYREPFFFYTSSQLKDTLNNSPNLIFIFNNGANDKASDLLLARLYLNSDKQLCLMSWPLKAGWKEGDIPISGYLEILMNRVENISFSFYVAPERDRSKITASLPKKAAENAEIPLPHDSWVSEWPHQYAHLPPMVKLHVTKEESTDPICFSFVLSQSQKLIVTESPL